ncbi:MAG: RluA family pseudouridine synthase [bacterium]|nr:RluA family pseudouridine synthase [bacterium]
MISKWTTTELQRLDAFIAQNSPDLSRSRIQKLIALGGVEVNGEEVVKSSHKLHVGDSVSLDLDVQSVVDVSITPVDIQLEILYEDRDCMVINKPAGYAVHPGSGMAADETTILHGVSFLFAAHSIPFNESSILVHRLDKDTTGCLLIAKSEKAHTDLQKQFAQRDVSKKYLAIVAGTPDPATAIIDAPIGRNLTDRTKMSVMRTSISREAKTSYETIDSCGKCSLLCCDLYTGRTHQVRVHLSSIGYPILGDTTYASPSSGELSKKLDISSLCLHAWKLTFVSLKEMKDIVVECEPPEAFTAALTAAALEMSTT